MSVYQTLDFSKLSQDAISELLHRYQLHLTPEEALTIQNELLGRPPTLAECILWSIQGSEHCSYKSTRHFLRQLPTQAPQILLGPKEDAGIVTVAIDQAGLRYGVVISHESHNHPSQIVPYEGAATGVGGNVRDVSCMGAEVIAIADSLRFGDINRARTHYIHQGVVSGIAGYGNPIGVPTIAGDLYYDAGYNDNCLVTVVTLGIVREDHVIHSYVPKNGHNYHFVLVGKPTDNSGFGGASFASSNLSANAANNKGAVQEPNAFLQRHLLKANYAFFKELQITNRIQDVGFKDLGAGGIACASVELADAAGFGADINLDDVATSISGLNPAVILCAETQERFMWVLPSDLVPLVLKHYNETFALPEVSEGACAKVIGKIRPDGLYQVHFQDQMIVSASASQITRGIKYDRPHAAQKASFDEPALSQPRDFNEILLLLLRHENIASRAPIFENYDKQVQGRTILEAGQADAGVLQPFNDDAYPVEIRQVGIALSVDQNPRYNVIDAYWGAINALIEAARNVAAVGAKPLAITDCLCFGNPEDPNQMQAFMDAVRGITDACHALKDEHDHPLPVVSGNVSLYNQSNAASIPPSPIISCLGQLPDVSYAISYHLKSVNNVLILIGERKDECGGSVYYQIQNALGAQIPKPDLASVNREITTVYSAIQQGLVLAAHDISEGGFAVALAEMSFRHGIGIDVDLVGNLPLDKKLFGESGGFILEIAHDSLNAFRRMAFEHQVSITVLGKTIAHPQLKINGVINLPIAVAKAAWEEGLRTRLL